MAQIQALDITDPAPAAERNLYLEVFINDASMKLIGNFKQLADGGLAATPEELTEVGLKPVDSAAQTMDWYGSTDCRTFPTK